MRQSGVYNESKMAWWLAKEGKLTEIPKQVQLVLSDLCNQSCGFCAYRMDGYSSNELFMVGATPAAFGHNNPNRMIPRERAMRLLDEMKEAGVLGIQFTGGGEPTVHPAHEEIMERALQLRLRCALVSNGVKWGERLIQRILPRFDWVRVSIDAGYQDSYAKIRRVSPSHWDKVWANVRSLAQAIKSRENLSDPLRQHETVLGLGFVVTRENFREIYPFAEAAKAAGAHNVRFSAMFSPEDDKPFIGIYNEIRYMIDVAKQRLEEEGFIINDNFGSRVDDLRQGAPDYSTCAYQHYTSYVGGDMNLYRCCVLAYNKRGLITSVKDKSFLDAWEEAKKDFAKFDARGCERCQFNEKNRQMNFLLGPKPTHVEWP